MSLSLVLLTVNLAKPQIDSLNPLPNIARLDGCGGNSPPIVFCHDGSEKPL